MGWVPVVTLLIANDSSGTLSPTSHTRPQADAGRTFRNRPFDAAPMAFAQG